MVSNQDGVTYDDQGDRPATYDECEAFAKEMLPRAMRGVREYPDWRERFARQDWMAAPAVVKDMIWDMLCLCDRFRDTDVYREASM